MTGRERVGYLKSHESGELAERIEKAVDLLIDCTLCPRKCRVNRLAGEKGFCRTGRHAVVASYDAHFGEESPLVGQHGSGTIFISNCNLGCVFCQNYSISHLGEGESVSSNQLAFMMLELQKCGCHNINFVTPSHVVPQILEALPEAIAGGLTIPLVYNCSGYDRVSTLKLLDGIFDIYMPDFKFWTSVSSKKYLLAPDYPERARAVVTEMHRQVGDLQIDEDGIGVRGLLVRHLIMPGLLGETASILEYIARRISPDTYINLMDQYHPCGKAGEFSEISRMLDQEEYRQALHLAEQAGLIRLAERDWLSLINRLM